MGLFANIIFVLRIAISAEKKFLIIYGILSRSFYILGKLMQGNINKLQNTYDINIVQQAKEPQPLERKDFIKPQSSVVSETTKDNFVRSHIVNTPNVEDPFREFIGQIELRRVIIAKRQKIKKHLDEAKISLAALSPIITARRISSLPFNIENQDYAKAAGLVAVAAVLLPEDLRDMKDAYNQVVHGKLPSYDFKNAQAPFSFIRGTLAEPVVNKMGKWGYYFHQMDKSLADTKLGEWFKNLFEIKITKIQNTKRLVPRVIIKDNEFKIEKVVVNAFEVSGNFTKKLIYRAMQRTTAIGTAILFALWIPSIIKAFKKPEETKDKFINAVKQTAKAVINNTAVISGIGLLGALGGRKGPAYSVLGMGVGSVLGSLAANIINKRIKTES